MLYYQSVKAMDKEQYLRVLEKKHTLYFDVFRDRRVGDQLFDIVAEFHARTERHLLTMVMDAYEAHEYRMIKCYDRFSLEEAERFAQWLVGEVRRRARPNEEHMCTIVTGAAISENPIEEGVKQFVKKFKHVKYHAFGLRGWQEVRLLAVDLSTGSVAANGRGRQVIDDFKISEAAVCSGNISKREVE
ncbi:MAG: Uncharacterized protein XD68_1510 [Synergistales bacterium 54_24]|nr:MAG: Uncharacterized protein XD68_1510 [Synergistales bacterium 54_24]